MNIFQLINTCFRSIFRNRMRSLLTSLGIIIGVGSVIIMVALGEGSQRLIEERMTSMGTNILQITPRRTTSRAGQTVYRTQGFTKRDVEALRTESTFIAAVSGLTSNSFTAVGPEGSSNVSVQGVEPDFFIARSWNVVEGYIFEDADLEDRTWTAILGQTTKERLFGDDVSPLNQQIRIGTNFFTIIGVLEEKGPGVSGNDQDNIILVPLDTALFRLTNSATLSSIIAKVVDRVYMDVAQQEADLILRDIRQIPDGARSDFDFRNQADMIEMATATTNTLTTLLAAIAGVSLLVGGIGIMNIMLVSVTERTREIGIRMAVGGRKRDILFQFLSESVILSLMGGLIGIGLAFFACWGLESLGIPTYINPLIVAVSALFAAAVGIVFGYYPALKAARLYPIDALRYE